MGNGVADIAGSTFLGNSASYGGAILNWIGSINVSNSTFFGNSAPYGGGIYNDVAFLTLTNSTFSGNSGEYGSGLHNAAGDVSMTNNILANSTSGSDCYLEEYGEFSTNAYNLIETNADSPNNCGTPALPGDPNLGPLVDNGGFTQTMALLPSSPAIDAGDDAMCPDVDQRGVARPQGTYCDIGAYEAEQSADTIQPAVISIVRADPNPTRAAYVDFTVTFSEAVTGVAARDFALKTFGGIRAAAITEVTGSGNVYTVTVRTGRGNGTLRLDVPARATITDLSGNSLGELPFKQGEVYKVVKQRR